MTFARSVRLAALPLAVCAPLLAQESPEKAGAPSDLARASDSILAVNASQYGVSYPETFVLMQNRRGLRIEYCVDRSRLQLWTSPLAGRSLDYRDRNWSNRDDHTAVFERILLPGLDLARFRGADWDPFHSVLRFEGQTLHLSQVYDHPAVLLWLEKAGAVDLKAAGGDRAVAREPLGFVVRHLDRGRAFEFAAALGPGAGRLRHQLVLDEGRAVHARAELAAGQLLVLAAGLEGEGAAETAREAAARPASSILEANEASIARDLATGRFRLKGRPEMQRLLEVNRRFALSMQDEGGFMRSTNQYIYYLLWFRDGGMNTAHLAMAGWPDPARQHVRVALANPNVSLEEPKGRFFGQVMGGPITKWEEDGLFYVVWPAFLHWTQTGDDSLVAGESLKVMEEALDWLERYAFDPAKGLFGRYYFCETPLTGSRDYGWDNATGAPTDRFDSVYEGRTITRSYDVYINSLAHSTYLMLSAMETGAKADAYLARARALEEGLRRFYAVPGPLPSYGDLLTSEKQTLAAARYGLDRTDYQWALSLPPFDSVSPEQQREARDRLLKDLLASPKGNFLCAWTALLRSMDPARHDEATMMKALEYLMPQSVRAGKYLVMPYSIPEIVDVEDGEPFHDVRPLVYSIAPWLSAVTNFGLHRLPFGVAVRGTRFLESIDRYAYGPSWLDVRFEGEGAIEAVLLDGRPLAGTLQLPDGALKAGGNAVLVRMSPRAGPREELVSSTVRLLSAAGRRYELVAYGQNRLTFSSLRHRTSLVDASGRVVPTREERAGAFTHVSFDGRGPHTLTLR
jgi:hypothetical protein